MQKPWEEKNDEPISPVNDTPGSSSFLYHRYAVITPIVEVYVPPKRSFIKVFDWHLSKITSFLVGQISQQKAAAPVNKFGFFPPNH